MTTKPKVTIWISLGVVALVGLAVMEVIRGARSFLAGFDHGMHANYEKISKAESKRLVFDALGEPRAKSDGFNLPQRHGFEQLFDAAEKTPAVEYYQWINGMNWYYCIGFDSDGIVVLKGEGHS
jgi:hypothetical protein